MFDIEMKEYKKKLLELNNWHEKISNMLHTEKDWLERRERYLFEMEMCMIDLDTIQKSLRIEHEIFVQTQEGVNRALKMVGLDNA